MKSQRGGFFLGMIVGLLIGLALSLGVAVYITKVPLPFIDKVPQRTAEQDAAEAEHNKNWDPNSGLYGKNPAKPHAVPQPVVDEAASAPAEPAASSASGAHPVTTDPAAPATATPAKPASAPAKAASSVRNPAAILSGEPVSTTSASDSFTYYVQAGAYANQAEAEQQKGKLALMDLEARVVEREVSGRIMYRVRIGPFGQREQAEDVRVRLSTNGVDSALVRVQK